MKIIMAVRPGIYMPQGPPDKQIGTEKQKAAQEEIPCVGKIVRLQSFRKWQMS